MIFFSLFLLTTACSRPSSPYEVQLEGGVGMSDVLKEPTPMTGSIEVARMRIHGHNIGLGVTGRFGDAPRADGIETILAQATFGVPPHPSFDRDSTWISALPDDFPLDHCITTNTPLTAPWGMEAVDVGDRIGIANDSMKLVLDRNPAFYPRPAGESWMVEYSAPLLPNIKDHPQISNNWQEGAKLTVSTMGGLPPESATIGAIPYPMNLNGMTLPESVEGLAIRGEEVRAPDHSNGEDPVRFEGPWDDAMTLAWTPGEAPLHVELRALGAGDEGPCDCTAACDTGFACDDGSCVAHGGATWVQQAALVCRVKDDGEFAINPAMIQDYLENSNAMGHILVVGRVQNGRAKDVPKVLTFHGDAVPSAPLRLRAMDLVFTRVVGP